VANPSLGKRERVSCDVGRMRLLLQGYDMQYKHGIALCGVQNKGAQLTG